LAYSEAYKQGKARTVAWGDLKEKLSKVIEAGETVEDINVEVAETSE
jgi:hypothetical protein